MNAESGTFDLAPITEGDLVLLHSLDERCFPGDVAYSLEDMAYFQGLAGFGGILARLEGEPAGFILFIENHIITLDVLPRYRRKGLGARLMVQAMAAMEELGYDRACLEVDVDNDAALALYHSLGFMEAGSFREMGRDRFFMTRCLNRPGP